MGVLSFLTGGAAPACPTCRQPMRKRVQYRGQVAGLIVGLLFIAGGVAVFILIPCFGWVLGPLLLILGLMQGGKRTNVWRCKACKVIIPRGS